MFVVEDYASVRQFVFVDGKSRREAARFFGLSRDTINKKQSHAGCYTSVRDYVPIAKVRLRETHVFFMDLPQ